MTEYSKPESVSNKEVIEKLKEINEGVNHNISLVKKMDDKLTHIHNTITDFLREIEKPGKRYNK